LPPYDSGPSPPPAKELVRRAGFPSPPAYRQAGTGEREGVRGLLLLIYDGAIIKSIFIIFKQRNQEKNEFVKKLFSNLIVAGWDYDSMVQMIINSGRKKEGGEG